jgi:flagellar hook-associated protein 3 FlgL
MAVSPVNVSRVSHNLQTSFVLASLQRTQRDLFTEQSRIATGRSFLTPGENPIAAGRALDLSDALAQQAQFVSNVRHGDNFLAAQDVSLTEINELLVQASTIANEMVNSLSTEAEREAEAEIVASIRSQIQALGNRQFGGRYLFAGRRTTTLPFVDAPGGVAYLGDVGRLFTRVDQNAITPINLPGNEVFGALSRPVDSAVDLSPNLTSDLRLDDLSGATGNGVNRGTLVFNESGGAGTFVVDLSSADTISDVVTLINDSATAAGSGLSASLGSRGLTVTPGGSPVTITDRSGGAVASSLGILTTAPVSTVIDGGDLGPRITRLTPVAALAGGAGIDLTGGLIITNGNRTATIDLSTALTVQDIINTINSADVYVLARINDDGTAIDVFNQVSGSALTIAENGGTTATDLGIRTLDSATPLEQVNLGTGVTTVEGLADMRITTRSGSTVDVNLDGAETIGDVIDLINQAAVAAGVGVQASLTPTGNGIQITDSTGGAGALSVSSLNVSTAPHQLGLIKTVTAAGAPLVGDDVNPTQTHGILDALIDLERALRNDDTQAISRAGNRLDELRAEATRMHGIIGARSQAMTRKLLQMEDAAMTTRIALSEVKDLDFAAAATQLQSALTQFQANLQTGSSLLSLSLLDFLR